MGKLEYLNDAAREFHETPDSHYGISKLDEQDGYTSADDLAINPVMVACSELLQLKLTIAVEPQIVEAILRVGIAQTLTNLKNSLDEREQDFFEAAWLICEETTCNVYQNLT